MSFVPPKKILITSDKNELALVKILTIKNVKSYVYKFTVSETKKNCEMEFDEEMLTKLLKQNIFKIIE